MFENFKVFQTEFAGRPLVIETGKMCGLSNGSCLVRYGETTVLCNVTASAKPREGIDFFPLSVDFEEKLYSVGKNSRLVYETRGQTVGQGDFNFPSGSTAPSARCSPKICATMFPL